MTVDRAQLEQQIRELAQQGEMARAATLAIEGYGPELLRFIGAMLRNEQLAADVFSQTCEDVWKGLPNMQWHSTFRTWAYAVARNACYRHLRSPERKRARPLSQLGEAGEAAERVRTATLPHLRTDMKSRIAALRKQLTAEEQELLTLRVDRGLEWLEIAEILSDEELDAAGLKRASAAQRKRFERTTEKLRKLATAEGLLDADDEG
jgi:RNA polymerase sigma-70 factor (ECF subfamily)